MIEGGRKAGATAESGPYILDCVSKPDLAGCVSPAKAEGSCAGLGVEGVLWLRWYVTRTASSALVLM